MVVAWWYVLFLLCGSKIAVTSTLNIVNSLHHSFCCYPFAEPREKEGDFFLLNGRMLMHDLEEILSPKDRDDLYRYAESLMKRGGVSTERKGGANGTGDDDLDWVDWNAFSKMVHYPGSTPRQGRGVILVFMGKKCLVCYVQPYKEDYNIIIYPYSIPVRANQIKLDLAKLNAAPPKVLEVLKLQVDAKLMAAEVLGALNDRVQQEKAGWRAVLNPEKKYHRKLGPHAKRLVGSAAVAVQRATNARIASCHEGSTDAGKIFAHHFCATMHTILMAAVFYHYDHTKKHIDLPNALDFLEIKMLFVIPSCCGDLKAFPNMPALGRGGAGPGQFMLAWIDHSFEQITGRRWNVFRDANFPNPQNQPNLHQFFQMIRMNNPVAAPNDDIQAVADQVRGGRLQARQARLRDARVARRNVG